MVRMSTSATLATLAALATLVHTRPNFLGCDESKWQIGDRVGNVMTARIAGPTETDGESDCLIEGVPEAYVANQAYTIRVGCSVFRGGRGCALLFHASGGTFAGQGDAGSTATCLTSNSRFDTLLERQWTAPSEDEAGDVSFRALCGHFTQAVRSEDFASSWGGEVYTAPPTDAPVTTDAPTTDAPTTDAPVNATECDCGFVNDADVAQGCAECPPAVTEPLKATFIGKAIDLTEFACSTREELEDGNAGNRFCHPGGPVIVNLIRDREVMDVWNSAEQTIHTRQTDSYVRLAPKVQQWIVTLNPDLTPEYVAHNLQREVGDYEDVGEAVWQGHPSCESAGTDSADVVPTYTGWITDVACYSAPNHAAFDTGLSVLESPELHTKKCMYDLKMCRDSGFYVLLTDDDQGGGSTPTTSSYGLKWKLGPSMNQQIVDYLSTSTRNAGFKVTLSGGVNGAGSDVGLNEADWWDCGDVTFVEGLPDLGVGEAAGEAGLIAAEEPAIDDDLDGGGSTPGGELSVAVHASSFAWATLAWVFVAAAVAKL